MRPSRVLPPPSGGRKLRIGIFADAPQQPRWMVDSLAGAAASGVAEIVAVAAGEKAGAAAPKLWRAFRRADHWLFGSRPDPSTPVDLRREFAAARTLALPQRDAGVAARKAYRAAVEALALDVAFALGEVDDALVEDAARHGVWRYCFGEAQDPREELAGFHEAAEGAPVTASALVVRHDGEERLAYQSWSRTYPYSAARNREQLLRKTAQFAGRALRELERAGAAWLGRCPRLGRVRRRRGARTPGGVELLRGVARLGRRIAGRGLQRLLHVEQWFIAFRFGGGERWPTDLRAFTRLLPPPDRYWADPFCLERGGRHYIFFEEYMLASGKGHIAVVEVSPGGARGAPRRVLERPYHLAYPFVFEHDGELYMTPDSGTHRTVDLYRCLEFPHRWQLEKTLLRGAWFVDATLHLEDDRWWMFVNVGVDGAEAHDELHLYHAERLLGEWQPHERNPVKSDARCARPAGRLFRRDGALYRPAQICAPRYGSGVSINRVLHLSPRGYVEQEEERVLPAQPEGLLGLHTLNRAGELWVADAFMRRRRR